MPRSPSPNQTPEQAKHAAYMREWMANHPEQRRKNTESAARWRKAHPEEMRAHRQKWAERNSELNFQVKKASQKRRYDADPEKFRKYARDWKKAHPEWNRERARQRKLMKKVNGKLDRSITLLAVAERDGWICGICHLGVVREEASVDHIFPLSLGGEHTWGNVQLAHHLCNTLKRGQLPDFLIVSGNGIVEGVPAEHPQGP